jgi:hypothetical protein
MDVEEEEPKRRSKRTTRRASTATMRLRMDAKGSIGKGNLNPYAEKIHEKKAFSHEIFVSFRPFGSF